MVSREYFNGDAVDGGVTLLVVTDDSLQFEDTLAAPSFELDLRVKEFTLGVGGVNIDRSSFALLLLDDMSSIMEGLCM